MVLVLADELLEQVRRLLGQVVGLADAPRGDEAGQVDEVEVGHVRAVAVEQQNFFEPMIRKALGDIQNLLDILHKLVSTGNTVILIEHNLDVIKCSDHVIDLGPDGGTNGGTIVATGSPEELAKLIEGAKAILVIDAFDAEEVDDDDAF